MTILHVDMDAFYAAVEVLDDPGLTNRPLVVGGTGRRGVVASCSYEARAHGVRSAMPTARARQLCPQAVFVQGRFDRYAEVSRQIHEIFERFTPLVEGIALDEAFLDVAGAVRLFGPAPAIGWAIRHAIAAELRLGCSVGVARVKFLAKLASEAAKPQASPQAILPGRGVVVIELGEELDFLHPLPVEALWGVGPVTAARLQRLGVTTVGELASLSPAILETAVGRAAGRHLHALSHAVDEREVEPHRATKSVGHEETYPFDRYERDDLGREVMRMADGVSSRLRQAGLAGRTVILKVRYGDFSTITRASSFGAPVDTVTEIARAATGLLDRVDVAPGVRLLGVSVSNLVVGTAQVGEQLALDFEAVGTSRPLTKGRRTWSAATAALDAVRRRYGPAAVGPAVLLGDEGLSPKRPGDSQWGPATPTRDG